MYIIPPKGLSVILIFLFFVLLALYKTIKKHKDHRKFILKLKQRWPLQKVDNTFNNMNIKDDQIDLGERVAFHVQGWWIIQDKVKIVVGAYDLQ